MNFLFVFLQNRELRYKRQKRSKKRAVARDLYLQDTKVFVRDISSHRDRFEEREKKILIDFTTCCNANADTEVPHTLLFTRLLINVYNKETNIKT